MRMSIRMTSGRRAGSRSTASWPPTHSATTSNPSVGERIRARPARTIAWSSTSATRIIACSPSATGSCVLRLQRKRAGHKPPVGCRPGGQLAAERRRTLTHPDQRRSVARSGSPAGAATVGPVVSAIRRARPSPTLEPENGPRARRVPCRVRERLLSDPVERDPDARGDRRDRSPRIRSSTARPPARASSTSAGISLADGSGGATAASSSLRSSATVRRSSSHAPPAHLLGRPQRLLRGRGVAVQHVAGARDLEHHGGQPVAHEVVDVAGDPAPLDQQRLLGELAPGGLELGDELALACGRAAEDPREGDAQDPDAAGRSPTDPGSGSRPPARARASRPERHGRRERPRPIARPRTRAGRPRTGAARAARSAVRRPPGRRWPQTQRRAALWVRRPTDRRRRRAPPPEPDRLSTTAG